MNTKLDPFKKNLLENPNLSVEHDIGKILVKRIKKLVEEIFNST